jgi:3-deoxy-D-manno-octulosonic-acid transferase
MLSVLDVAYGTALTAAAPWLAYKAATTGKYRAGWGQKLLGCVPRRASGGRCLWVHAVSVGEVLALRPLLPRLRARCPGWDYVVSTTTNTGLEIARKQFPEAQSFYFPFDFSWAVRRALRRIRPDAVALVELELWPQFIKQVHDCGIPLALVNGRMSPRSFRGYGRLGWLTRRALRRFDVLAVQNEEYAERFAALGASRDRIVVTGSVKYDGIETERCNARTAALRELLGIGEEEAVWVAGSTQAPEEELALDVYERLLPEFPQLRLLLVPRHKERFEEVAGLLERRGVPLVRRSRLGGGVRAPHFRAARARVAAEVSGESSEGSWRGAARARRPVILVDTLGELSAVWGLADVAFVGGSLSGRGGQNMIEPAAYGAAVLFGPDTWKFRETVESLLAGEAALVVHDGDELRGALRRLLADAGEARRLGQRARHFVMTQQGASERTIECLRKRILSRAASVKGRGMAAR